MKRKKTTIDVFSDREVFYNNNSFFDKKTFKITKFIEALENLSECGFFSKNTLTLKSDNGTELKIDSYKNFVENDELKNSKFIGSFLNKGVVNEDFFMNFHQKNENFLDGCLTNSDFEKKFIIQCFLEFDQIEDLCNLISDNDIRKLEETIEEQKIIWDCVLNDFFDYFKAPFSLNFSEGNILKNSKDMFFLKYCYEGNFVDKDYLIKNLSQGEKRSFYLLDCMFKIKSFFNELNKSDSAVIVFDDIVDSFDYANKYAVIGALKKICDDYKNLNRNSSCYIFLMTHNYDFLRSLNKAFGKENQFFGLKDEHKNISLKKVNIDEDFEKKWIKCSKEIIVNKQELCDFNGKDFNSSCLFAAFPLIREVYSKASKIKKSLNVEKNKMLSFLHYMEDTDKLKMNDFYKVFSSLLGVEETAKFNKYDNIQDFYVETLKNICGSYKIGLPPLENELHKKICLSIYIRIMTEKEIKRELDLQGKNIDYLEIKANQFGYLMNEYNKLDFQVCKKDYRKLFNKINWCASGFIHFNSFMYEVLIDTPISVLIGLYDEVNSF